MNDNEMDYQHLPPDTGEYTWDDAKEDCIDSSSTIGDAIGALYEYGANEITGGAVPDVAVEIGDTIGGFVEENWAEVCKLPEKIIDTVTDIFSGNETESMPFDQDTTNVIDMIDDPIDAADARQNFSPTDSDSSIGIEDASINSSVDYSMM